MRILLPFLFISVFSFGQVPNYVPTNGLVAWYGFNGNANDESGNGPDGTVNGATLTDVPNTHSTFFATGASGGKIIKFNTVAAGCASSAVGQGQIQSTTHNRVPTIYAHGLCYYDNCALSNQNCP